MTYFKSITFMDNVPQTQTYDTETNQRYTCQKLDEIIHDRKIKPNTKHAKLSPRLCVSAITKKYSGTYRPEGIVFESEDTPAYCAPFDMMTLTTGKTFTSKDHDSKFLKGHEQFVYNNIETMLKENTPEKATQKLNEFRTQHGLEEVPVIKYNEVCFEKSIDIKPKALIGKSSQMKELASIYNLPIYENMTEYQNAITQPSIADFTRKSAVGALFRVGASFTIDAMTYLAVTNGKLGEFFDRFEADKFLTVTAAVVGINYIDYKWKITERLDNGVKNIWKNLQKGYSIKG